MKLKYYFSTTSPFCYTGNQRIFDMEKDFGFKWELKPYAIAKPTDASPPDPSEMKYLQTDIKRLITYYQLPLLFPKKPPKNRSHLECFFIASDKGKGKEYLLAANRFYWGEGKDIGELDVLLEIAKSIGLDGKDFKDKYEDPGLKERLKISTDEGNADGVFGVPTLFIEDEIFWGQDRLDFAHRKLGRALLPQE